MQEPVSIQATTSSDEISVKEVILRGIKLFKYLLSYWILLVLLGLAGGAIGYWLVVSKKPTYTADLTFVVEDAKSGSGGMGSYAGLASSFGIDLGTTSGSGLFQGDNIFEFLKSRLMVQKALLTPSLSNSQISLADEFFELSKMKEVWDSQERTKNIHFPINGTGFSRLQDSGLGVIHQRIIDSYLTITRTDKKMSFIKASCTSTNELFSKAFVENLVAEATDFYVQTKTKRSKENVDNLQRKADSLLRIMNAKTYAAAMSQDLNLNPARRIATVNVELTNRDKLVAQTIFQEVVKNLELAKSALSQDMPIIQMIDAPILPLTIQKKSKSRSILITGFIFGFLGVLFLTLRKYLRSVFKH
jgi:hypothetical protein